MNGYCPLLISPVFWEGYKLLCKIYKVERMYLFGSATNSNFTNTSDIDLLVKFKNMDLSDYFDNYVGLKNRLEKIFGRNIDLVEEQTLRNPILINSIRNSMELIYG
jgi:predicted nucleotidyltransferase